jgi:hypothetical protein
LEAGPDWLNEEHGPTRWHHIIVMALDRHNYDHDPGWCKPYVWQNHSYAPLESLLQEYSDESIKFAGTVADAIALVDTYIDAYNVAFGMMEHLPNPHQCHMGGIAIFLDENGIELSRTERTLRP